VVRKAAPSNDCLSFCFDTAVVVVEAAELTLEVLLVGMVDPVELLVVLLLLLAADDSPAALMVMIFFVWRVGGGGRAMEKVVGENVAGERRRGQRADVCLASAGRMDLHVE